MSNADSSRKSPWVRRARLFTLGLALVCAIVTLLSQLAPHYELHRWLFWRYLDCWALGAAFSAFCTSAGFALLKAIGPRHIPLRERLVFSMACGVLIFYLGMFLGGLAGLYHAAFAVAWPIVMFAVGAWPLYRSLRRVFPHWRSARQRARRWGNWQILAMVLGGIGLLMVYVNILTPDNASYDSRWYHLALPEDYVAAGGLYRSPEGWFHTALPQLACLVYLWPYLFHWLLPFDHVEIAAHLEFVFFVWTLLSVGPLVRYLVPKARTAATWAAYFLFSGIFCYDSTLNVGADHIAAFWAIPIYLTMRRAWPKLELRPCLLLGVMLAGAISTKVQAVELLVFPSAVIAIRGVWLLVLKLRRRDQLLRIHRFAFWTGPLVVAGTLLLLTTPYWLKNWIWYGDPLYPALYKHLHLHPWHPDMDHFYVTLVERHFWRPEGTFGQKALLTAKALFTFSFKPHDWDFMHRDWPVFGFLFTLSWFAMPFIKAGRRLWVAFIGGHVGVVTWFLFSAQDRYLQIIVPWMVACVAAVILRAWSEGWFVRVPLLGLIGLQAVWGGAAYFIPSHSQISGGRPLPRVLELLSSGYRKAPQGRLDVFTDFAAVGAATPKDAVILLHRMEKHVGLRRRIVMDHPSWQALIDYNRLDSERDVYDLYRSIGVTHVLWSDGNTVSEDSIAGDLRFYDFVSHVTQPERKIGGLLLGEMPREPPSRRIRDTVLYLGCHGYKAGLYQLGDMTVPGMKPPPHTVYPRPRQPLKAPRAEMIEALAQQANYAVTDAKCNALYQLPGSVSGAFEHRAHRSNEQLYVRREPLLVK
jgi:hypothetical protein